MEIIYRSKDLYDTTNPGRLKEDETVRRVITQVEQDYQRKTLQDKYFFTVNKRQYFAQVVNKDQTDKILIRKKYTLGTLIRDFIDLFI